MFNFKKFLVNKAFAVDTSKSEKELLEFFISNKFEFDAWVEKQNIPRIRFQFFYPTAVDFFFDDFKLFTAYFKKGLLDRLELTEFKMSDTNYNSIRSTNWKPFEEVIIDFLTTLEESKKIELFEKRKSLIDYEFICSGRAATANDTPKPTTANNFSPFQALSSIR